MSERDGSDRPARDPDSSRPPTDVRSDSSFAGAGLALVGGLLMGGVGVAGKFGAQAGLSPFQLLAAQVALLAPLAGVVLARRSGAAGFVPVRPSMLVVRTVSGFTYFVSFYWALQGIPVADALVLESTNPFFSMCIARVLLGQRVDRGSIAMAVIAFAGVCLILIHHDVQGLFNPYSLLALFAGFARAAGSVSTGLAGETEPPERIMFFYAAGMFLLCVAVLPWQWTPISGTHTWLILAAPALLFVPQNLAYTIANRRAPAYLVGALFYSAILVGVAADRLLWHSTIGPRGLIGMALTVGAGLGLAWLRARRSGSFPG